MIQLTAPVIVLLFSFFSFYLVFPDSYAQAQSSVSSVTLHQEGDGRERIRIKLEGTHDPKVYTLDGDSPRLICDFPGAGYAGLVKPVVRGGGTLVQRIRVGAHNPPDKKVRVVLDIEPGRKYTYTRDFSKEENILNILLVPAGPVKKAEKAVAVIEATEAKQVVITGPKKIYRPTGSQQQEAATQQEKTAQPETEQPAVESLSMALGASEAEEKEAESSAAASPIAEPPAAEPPSAEPVAEEQEETVAAVAEPATEPVSQPQAAAETAVTPPAPEPEVKPADPAPDLEMAAVPAPVAGEKPAEAEKPEGQAAPIASPPVEKVAEPEAAAEQPEPPPAEKPDAGAAKPQLVEVSYENSSSKGEMIFFRLNGFYPPDVTADESETPQVNCLFADMELSPDVQQTIEARGAYVQKISTTADKKSGKIRVSVDLAAGRDYDLRQVFFKEDNLFVLIVNTLDEESVGEAKGSETEAGGN